MRLPPHQTQNHVYEEKNLCDKEQSYSKYELAILGQKKVPQGNVTRFASSCGAQPVQHPEKQARGCERHPEMQLPEQHGRIRPGSAIQKAVQPREDSGECDKAKIEMN